MTLALGPEAAEKLAECVSAGGVAVFPSDTVYGICCDPQDEAAAQRLYELKGRPSARSCAVMFFDLQLALDTLEDLTDRERKALRALLPGGVTLLLPNRAHRYCAACRVDPDTLGLRVPLLAGALSALATVGVPLMQSSANLSGEPDARELEQVPQRLREGVDLIIDGGALQGTPSTVVDLRELEGEGNWYVLREGAVAREDVDRALAAVG